MAKRKNVKSGKTFAVTGLTSVLRLFLLSKIKAYSKKKVLFITLVVFSIGVFGSYSKTSSKYLIDKNDNIINKTNFKILKF